MKVGRQMIEILHMRDPDASCEFEVYLNGERVNFHLESVDPGAGYTAEDWEEKTASIEANRSLSEPFIAAVIAAREVASDSEYITET